MVLRAGFRGRNISGSMKSEQFLLSFCPIPCRNYTTEFLFYFWTVVFFFSFFLSFFFYGSFDKGKDIFNIFHHDNDSSVGEGSTAYIDTADQLDIYVPILFFFPSAKHKFPLLSKQVICISSRLCARFFFEYSTCGEALARAMRPEEEQGPTFIRAQT